MYYVGRVMRIGGGLLCDDIFGQKLTLDVVTLLYVKLAAVYASLPLSFVACLAAHFMYLCMSWGFRLLHIPPLDFTILSG